MAKKTRPRAHQPQEITVMQVLPGPQGQGIGVTLCRGPLPAGAKNPPPSGLIVVQGDVNGNIQVRGAEWVTLDQLAPILRDGVYAACGDPDAKERIQQPGIAPATPPVLTLVAPNGAPLLHKIGRA